MKILKKIILLTIYIFFIIQLFKYPNLVINSINLALDLWFKKIIPTLIPFLLFSNFLINYGFVEILSELFKPIMSFFKLNENCAFIIIISLITGTPGNVFFIKEALDNNLINEKDASKLLMITQFTSPLFIIGTIGNLLNKKIALFILIITYSSNLILAFLLKKVYPNNSKSKFRLENIKNKLSSNCKSFGKILVETIKKISDTLLIILGSMCFFYIVTTILNEKLVLNDLVYSILSGILEMTQGIFNVCLLNIPIKVKIFLITIFISFGGLSIHSQIISIISDTKIKYLPYLFARLLHAIISGGIIYLII